MTIMSEGKHSPELIVMLTHHDFTVVDAAEIFRRCKNSKARCWGMKEHPLPPQQMSDLYAQMKACGKTTFLEVVAYSEAEGMAGAELAVKCGCDVLMGTSFSESISAYCQEHRLKYMPFVGQVTGRPSVLSGSVESMVAEAHECLAKGAYGIDLLGYRYDGDAPEMIRQFLAKMNAPVCVAGSIDSYKRLDEIKAMAPWAFTIGSAFFEGRFLDGQEDKEDCMTRFCEQINCVCDYMERG